MVKRVISTSIGLLLILGALLAPQRMYDSIYASWEAREIPVVSTYVVPISVELWEILKKPIVVEMDRRKEIAQQQLEQEKEELKRSAVEEVTEAQDSLWERIKDAIDRF